MNQGISPTKRTMPVTASGGGILRRLYTIGVTSRANVPLANAKTNKMPGKNFVAAVTGISGVDEKRKRAINIKGIATSAVKKDIIQTTVMATDLRSSSA